MSGTNVWVRMYVQGSLANNDHTCRALLGTDPLAQGLDIRVNPHSALWCDIRTDGLGNWQSPSDLGYVKFSTCTLSSGMQADLCIELEPYPGMPRFQSTARSDIRLYNKAYVLGSWKPGADGQADYVHQKCEAIYHTSSPMDTVNSSDSKATILSNLPSYTVFYFAGEGGDIRDDFAQQYYFWDCISQDNGHEVYSLGEVHPSVVEGKTVQPYYNFVHLDACFSGENDSMPRAFGILGSLGQVNADRAYIGWKGWYLGLPQITTGWTSVFWDRLAAGDTVLDAKTEASRGRIDPATCQIYGDRNTVLHGAYCGTIRPYD